MFNQGFIVTRTKGIANSPYIGSRNNRDPGENIDDARGRRTRYNTPTASVPMDDEWLNMTAKVRVSNGPNIGTGNGGYSVERVVERSDNWATDDAPLCSAPVFCQCLALCYARTCIDIGTNSPNICCGDTRHALKYIGIRPDIRTCYYGSAPFACDC